MLADRRRTSLSLIIGTALVIGACTTDPYTGESKISKTAIGAGIGAAGGAVVGLLTGSDSKSKRRNALIGAGIGALAGGAVGLYMDNQEAELRKKLQGAGVQVERQGDQIRLNMANSLNFDVNSANLRGESYPVLDAVKDVLVKYEKTTIDVTGHTDSDGDDAFNQDLSQRRAFSVGNQLAQIGVKPVRVLAAGMGEKLPIAPNTTPAGKQANRRVELQISPIVQN